MVRIWTIRDSYPEKMVGVYDRAKSSDRLLLKKSRRVDSGFVAAVRFKESLSKLKLEDDLASNALVPLVSAKVESVLRAICPDDVQLLDCEVIDSSGQLNSDYKLVNALNSVNALDLASSEYSLVPGTSRIMSIRKAVFRQDCLGSFHIARDREYMSNLLVGAPLYEAFRAAGCTLGLYTADNMKW